MRYLARVLECLGVLLYYAGAARLVIRARPHALRVLLYHACQPHEDAFIAGLSSNTTPANFAAHMAFVARHYSVISVDALGADDRPKCAAVITFDDGYRSVLEEAVPVLEQHGLRYTVYLVTDVVGNETMVWVNELNVLMRCSEEVRHFVASTLDASTASSPERLIDIARSTFDQDRLRGILESSRRLADVDAGAFAADARLYLSWDEIRTIAERGATVGNHTRTHPSLPRLDGQQVRDEVTAAHDTVVDELGHCDTFAHPFSDRSEVACHELRRLGYRSVMNVGGPQTTPHPYAVSRVPVPDAGAARLFATLEIVEPAKAWLRGVLGGNG